MDHQCQQQENRPGQRCPEVTGGEKGRARAQQEELPGDYRVKSH